MAFFFVIRKSVSQNIWAASHVSKFFAVIPNFASYCAGKVKIFNPYASVELSNLAGFFPLFFFFNIIEGYDVNKKGERKKKMAKKYGVGDINKMRRKESKVGLERLAMIGDCAVTGFITTCNFDTTWR